MSRFLGIVLNDCPGFRKEIRIYEISVHSLVELSRELARITLNPVRNGFTSKRRTAGIHFLPGYLKKTTLGHQMDQQDLGGQCFSRPTIADVATWM